MTAGDWNPAAYAAFRGLRLCPALDLPAQVPDWRPVSVDASPAMLGRAEGPAETVLADSAGRTPAAPPALVFWSAALQWLSDHTRLLPRLAAVMAPGGALAVQMPRNFPAASHARRREIAAPLFPDRFDCTGRAPATRPPETSRALLSSLGWLPVWKTGQRQPLPPQPEGHPVRAVTRATALRPFPDRMTAEEAVRFTDRYDEALPSADPALPDGTVLFLFRRLCLLLKRP